MAFSHISGKPISGPVELIHPGQIWEPDQPDTTREKINFTELVKVVSDDAKEGIMLFGGFRGNPKPYNKNQEGGYMQASFSWWSVHIPPDEKERLQNNLLEGEELADIYEAGSRYGTNVFHLDLDQLLSAYAECCGSQAEIRVLGTYVYKREVMHAFVVVPSGDETFSEHSLVARYDADYFGPVPVMVGKGIFPEMRHPFKIHYSWEPFSVITWKSYAPYPKQRMWAHQAFAFFLDPLPEKIMRVPEVLDETKWETCQQMEIDLVTSFIDE